MLLLVRHGESTANAAGLLLGRTDVELTERGRQQAAAARPYLGPVQGFTSSPLRRALDTAAILAGERPIEIDERWVEVDYGEYEGRPLGQVPADVWRRWRTDPDFRPTDGETLGEVGARVRQACGEFFAEDGQGARDPAGDRVVVSHVSPIKAAVAWALGADDGVAWRLHLSTASVTRIGWGADGPVVHAFNLTPVS